MQWWNTPLLILSLLSITESCSSSGYSNHPKSNHGVCAPLRDAVYECTYLNGAECKPPIKTKTRIICDDSEGMFLKGDLDSFPINNLICNEETHLWMVDGGIKSVFDTVGDDVGVACYDRPHRVQKRRIN